MGDIMRAADDVANYVNNPNDTTRKLAEDSITTNVGTGKQDLQALTNVFVGTGTLPELAVIEYQRDRFHDDDGSLTQAEFGQIADNEHNPNLTRLAALMSEKWYAEIQKADEGQQTLLGSPIYHAFDQVEMSELDAFAKHSKAAEKRNGLGFGDGTNNGTTSDLSTNVVFDKSLDANALIGVIGNKDQSPGQRLQAAYALYEKGQTQFTVNDSDGKPLNITISADSSGMISLWSPSFNGPIMRGVVRDGVTSQQGGASFFGTKWAASHPGSIFS